MIYSMQKRKKEISRDKFLTPLESRGGEAA